MECLQTCLSPLLRRRSKPLPVLPCGAAGCTTSSSTASLLPSLLFLLNKPMPYKATLRIGQADGPVVSWIKQYFVHVVARSLMQETSVCWYRKSYLSPNAGQLHGSVESQHRLPTPDTLRNQEEMCRAGSSATALSGDQAEHTHSHVGNITKSLAKTASRGVDCISGILRDGHCQQCWRRRTAGA